MIRSEQSSKIGIGFLGLLISGVMIMIINMDISEYANEEITHLLESFKTVIIVIAGFNALLGAILMISGFLSLAMGEASLSSCVSSEADIVSFVCFKGKRYRNFEVDISKLSKESKLSIEKKVEQPLKQLYETAIGSKRAEEVYKSVSPYIVTVGEDLKKAISECKNELMETALIDRLFVVEEFINELRDDIENALKTDADEKAILEKLQLEEYRPFSLTEQLNKLI